VTTSKGETIVFLPEQSQHVFGVRECLEDWKAQKFYDQAVFMPVEQSMRNGGGPACLRLRTELTSEERYACHRDVFLTTELYETLVAWIDKYYRDELKVDDLRDPKLMNESFHALDELTRILNLPRLYFFQ
jgi:succinylarginine dihydrolase